MLLVNDQIAHRSSRLFYLCEVCKAELTAVDSCLDEGKQTEQSWVSQFQLRVTTGGSWIGQICLDLHCSAVEKTTR